MGAKDLLQLVKSLLKLPSVAGTQARLLPFFVLAECAIAAAPPARRLAAIAFYL